MIASAQSSITTTTSTRSRLWNCWSLESPEKCLSYLLWHLQKSEKHNLDESAALDELSKADLRAYVDTKSDRDEMRRWHEQSEQDAKRRKTQTSSGSGQTDIVDFSTAPVRSDFSVVPTRAQQNQLARSHNVGWVAESFLFCEVEHM